MTSPSQKLYGLIGRTLRHSFSQDFFTRKFNVEGIDAKYLNFELEDIDEFIEVIAQYPTLRGLNVTIPYKQDVMDYMDELDPTAQRIGAVNVVKFNGSGIQLRLKGFNSDIIGFKDSIAPLISKSMTRALVLGTGGASKAVVCGLEDLGLECQLVSRTAREGIISYSDITRKIMESHHVIVNTTPLGMWPNTDVSPDIPYEFITPAHLCYDLIYNPEQTLFMKKSAERGALTKNGLEMLHLQAIASWNIWNE